MKKLLLMLFIFIAFTGAAFAVTGDVSVEGRLDATGNISAVNLFGNGANLTSLGVLTGVTIETAASGTYTVPTGVTEIEAILIGGGGGGGGSNSASSGTSAAAGGGGGAGAYTRKRIATSGGTTYTFAVGVGGTGESAAAGYDGGQTQFNGTTYTANGGIGGAAMAAGSTVLTAAGGDGGAAGATGDVNIPGNAGDTGYRISGTQGRSGAGGASLYGSQSASVYVSTINTGITGTAGTLYGGGGAGGTSQRSTGGGGPWPSIGGAGADGVIIIHEYK
jgi:hypothetical protein